MSTTQTYSIVCPKCEAEQDVDLFDSINVQEAPDLRDALMANQLNAVVCPHCSFQFRVDKRLLYNDPERRVMIYWFPGSEQDFAENRDAFLQSMDALNAALPDTFEPPAVHLVFQRTELIERIFLLEAELNERVIEYVKYMMYSRNMEKLNPHSKALLFNAQDSTEEALCFVVQDVESRKLEGMLQFERSAYDSHEEMFDSDDKTANLQQLFPGPYINARMLFLQDGTQSPTG
jgi:hypothetical protein